MLSEHMIVAQSYNYRLVALSVLVAMAASYAALNLAGRVRAAQGRSRLVWLAGGAMAMGTGIWSMHYIGMLALNLSVNVQYDWRIVLLSVFAAVFASGEALIVVSREEMNLQRAVAGSAVMGAGIALMHYIGMAAMRMPAMCHYDLAIVVVSVVIAIVISFVALWLAFHFRNDLKDRVLRKVGSAIFMGCAIPIMHYTGMAAVSFTASDVIPDLSHSVSVTALGTAGIASITFLILAFSVLLSLHSAQSARLAHADQRYRSLFERSLAGVIRSGEDGNILDCNDAFARILGFSSRQELVGQSMKDRWFSQADRSAYHATLRKDKCSVNHRHQFRRKDGSAVWVLANTSFFDGRDGDPGVVEGTLIDITEEKNKEVASLHSQKLEAVGGLAAGIAHEINTPIQFIGDNARFVRDSFGGIRELIERHEQVREQASQGLVDEEVLKLAKAAWDQADWPYLRDEVPKALDQLLDGVNRVAKIVRAMKEFSHVDQSAEKTPADLNKALESTLVVASNELKYVATVEADYGGLPLVSCHVGDLNQVFLNLLVNAAHAVGDVMKVSGKMGQIEVRTRQEGEGVEIAISDTGTGIREEVRNKVFDPFFTTKEVGKGSGQGLALARTIVVEKHGGRLTFETEMGKGTTFKIWLPLCSNAVEKEVMA